MDIIKKKYLDFLKKSDINKTENVNFFLDKEKNFYEHFKKL